MSIELNACLLIIGYHLASKWRQMASAVLVNIGSGNGMSPDRA